MTWRHKTVIRILMLVAKIVAGSDSALCAELQCVATHISVARQDEIEAVGR